MAILAGVMLVLVLHSHSETNPAVAESAAPLAAESVSVDVTPSIVNTAWHVLDPDTVDELPVYKEVVPGRVLVHISDSLASWEEREVVVLDIPQLGGSFDGLVEQVEVDPWATEATPDC